MAVFPFLCLSNTCFSFLFMSDARVSFALSNYSFSFLSLSNGCVCLSLSVKGLYFHSSVCLIPVVFFSFCLMYHVFHFTFCFVSHSLFSAISLPYLSVYASLSISVHVCCLFNCNACLSLLSTPPSSFYLYLCQSWAHRSLKSLNRSSLLSEP